MTSEPNHRSPRDSMSNSMSSGKRNIEVRRGSTYTPPMPSKKPKKHIKVKLALAVFLAGIMTVAVSYCMQSVMLIETVTVNDETYCSAKDALAITGIQEGDSLFSYRRSSAQKALIDALAYVADVRITRVIPDGIHFEFSYIKPCLYMEFSDRYYVLSHNLDVLEMTSDVESLERRNLMRLYPHDIEECIVGSPLVCKDPAVADALRDILDVMEAEEILQDCGELDLRNIFSVSFEYRRRFTVKFGDLYDADIKISFLKSILPEIGDNDHGILDLTDESHHIGRFLKD